MVMRGKKRILSTEELLEAARLRTNGWSKRKLAEHFEVGETTIWDNVYSTGTPKKKKIINKLPHFKKSFRTLPSVVHIIITLRNNDVTSYEISGILDIPLEEVNYIFAHNP
jgi:hypothetical protein